MAVEVGLCVVLGVMVAALFLVSCGLHPTPTPKKPKKPHNPQEAQNGTATERNRQTQRQARTKPQPARKRY